MDALMIPTGNGMERSLVQAWLSGRSPETLRAYGADLDDFARFVGTGNLDVAAKRLLSLSPGNANALVLEYRTHLIERGLASATINRRLASLRSLLKLGRTFGLVTWTLEIENVKSRAYRDTRGPGLYVVRAMLEKLDERGGKKAVRDRAIVRLLFDLGLRRGEVVRLNLEDIDGDAIQILGKGRTEKEILSLAEPTKEALQAWIEIRGSEAGPLFTSLDRARKGSGRLSSSGVYRLVLNLGAEVGVKTRPHGLRHTAITEAVKAGQANGMDLTEVLDFSRHANVGTLQIYRDRETNRQGKLTKLIAGNA